MITNTGKDILAKYLVGQTSSYASYIAVGCGKKPRYTSDPSVDYSAETSLGFEMFRVPIISKGYVTEGGVSKVVLTAELPTEERYEISEIGVYSAGANPLAAGKDSRHLYTFSQSENWSYHSPTTTKSIDIVYEPLDGVNNNDIIIGEYLIDGVLTSTPALQTNANNKIFSSANRVARYENCRFYNNIVAIVGNSATLTKTSGNLVVGADSSHIHVTGVHLEALADNLPDDELRLAFSVINKDGASAVSPDNVKIMVEFGSTDVHGTGEYARMEIDLDPGTLEGQHDFLTNRYVVAKKKLSELKTSSSFTWNTVDSVKIYVCVTDNSAPSSDFYVCLDALRLENTTTTNAIYGMTGYSVIKNTGATTITKNANTSSMIEFRFGIGVA